jgi:hypothetical protein
MLDLGNRQQTQITRSRWTLRLDTNGEHRLLRWLRWPQKKKAGVFSSVLSLFHLRNLRNLSHLRSPLDWR